MTYLAGWSLVWIWLQKQFDELLGFWTDLLPIALMENDTAVLALLNQIGQVLGPERGVTAQKGVGDDAHGPHINRLPVTFLKHDFRCSITK